MSSTAVQTSAHSLGGREERTMSQSYMSWTPDPYAPRDAAQRQYDQNGQAMRLPPPASLIGGPPNNRDAPQLHQNLQQQQSRPSYPYQDPYVPATAPRHPQPPPLQQSIPQPFHGGPLSPDHSRRCESDISQFSPTFQPNSREAFDNFSGRRVSQFSPERPAISPGSVSYRQSEHAAGLDSRLSLSHSSQQPHPAVHSSRPPMIAHNSQYNAPRLGSDARLDPMNIADLVDGRRHSGGNEVEYKLQIRQQPVAARSCGFGERDRRVIDPPPIVQLIVQGPNLSEQDVAARLRYCHYIMSCSIYDESGTRDASFMPEEYRQQRRLMGSLVGAPFVGKDENENEGCFFCFPDLSCRTPGAFRLKFSLVKIDPTRASQVRHFPVLTEAQSDVFTVYNAKDFPGMQASTRLTKRLKEQGCIISIKKGNDKARESKNSRGLDESSDEDGEASQGKRKRRSTRQ